MDVKDRKSPQEQIEDLLNSPELQKFLKKELNPPTYGLINDQQREVQTSENKITPPAGTQNSLFSIYKCIVDNKVQKERPMGSILTEIRTGKLYAQVISKARKAKRGGSIYSHFENHYLPAFSPNAAFNEKLTKKNLRKLTGYMYIEVKGTTELPDFPYIYASWITLSGIDRAILIKVQGVTKTNFKQVYIQLSEELGITVDPNLADYTCKVVLSHDPHLYLNPGSVTYVVGNDAGKKNNPPLKVALKKEEGKKYKLKRGGLSNEKTGSKLMAEGQTAEISLNQEKISAKENKNSLVSLFKCVKDPKVVIERPIANVLHVIKTGNAYKDVILKARQAGKNTSLYDHLKTTQIPTFSPNASFESKRTAKNMKGLTGLMYLDLDNCTELQLSPLIYATWLSLSGSGRGILVKTKDVTKDNFKDAYYSVAKELGIEADPQCVDITRQVVLSFDPEIYLNEESETYEYKGGKDTTERMECTITPLKVELKKRGEKKYESEGGLFNEDTKWNDLHTCDLEGQDYIIFETKTFFSKAYVPENIPQGRRFLMVSAVSHQMTALNLHWSQEEVNSFLNILNSRCHPPLPQTEIQSILRNLLKRKESGNLKPLKNFGRYVIFSDKVSKKEKQSIGGSIGGKISGRIKVNKTKAKIQECLDSWDLLKGKVTNRAIAEYTGLALKTIDKYSKLFKEQKAQINKNAKEEKKNNSKKRDRENPSEEK